MATLKDVAKKAGVSPATVSYTLRDGQYVSPSTRAKVLTAAKKLGYSTNIQARSLRYGRTGIIEIAVHELDIPYFYSKMTEVMGSVIEKHGYQALVMQTGLNGQNVKSAVSKIANQMCDGLILHPARVPAGEIKQLSLNRPTVLFDDCSSQTVLDSVIVPHEAAAMTATRHLIQQGCKRIGVVGFPYMTSDQLGQAGSTAALRLRGIVGALSEAGMELGQSQCLPCEWIVEAGRGMAQEIVSRGLPFDGIICANDGVALGLIRGFADFGVSVPAGVKVIGFDGISIAQYSVPSLTTMELDMDDLASKTVSLLLDRIQGSYRGDPRRVETRYSLKVRESTQGVCF